MESRPKGKRGGGRGKAASLGKSKAKCEAKSNQTIWEFLRGIEENDRKFRSRIGQPLKGKNQE